MKVPQLLRVVGVMILALAMSVPPVAARQVSVVDYLTALKRPSDFAARKQLFGTFYPNENYTGTVGQNTRLLTKLVATKKEVVLPLASGKVEGCASFYGHPEISKFMTEALAKNALTACVVTGTTVPATKIREALQKLYKERKPADGKLFTAAEHKKIHDDAYAAAGCTEHSANILAWVAVDAVTWSDVVVQKAIEILGQCTIPDGP